jgi:translocon-associated protein subunit alpha
LLGSLALAQDLTEDEETVEDSIIEDEDDEAEVEEDEPTDLVSVIYCSVHLEFR